MQNKEVPDDFMTYDVSHKGPLAPAINDDGRKKKLLPRIVIVVVAIVGICCVWTSPTTNTTPLSAEASLSYEEETVNLMVKETNKGIWGRYKGMKKVPSGSFACGARLFYEGS